MRILFLNQHFGPEAPATGVLLYQLVTALRARHEITVVAGDAAPCPGVTVHRVRAAALGDKSTVRRIAHYVTYFVAALWRGLTADRPDAVVCLSTPPLLAPLLARLLAAYHRAPYYYNVQDLYPDVALAAGRLPAAAAPAFTRAARWLERGAAGVSAVGDRMAGELARGRGVSARVLPNWADTDELRPVPPEASLRGSWGLNGRFVVLYSGNLGVCHDAEYLAAAVDLLRDQPVDFLFVLEPAAELRLRSLVPANPRLHFRPRQPRAKLAALLGAADVGLVSLGRGMSRYAVPCKTYGVLAAGRPLVAVSDLGDDLHALVRDEGCGLWASAGDPGSLARALLRLHADPALCARLGAAGRRAAVSRYSVAAAAARWEQWWGLADVPAVKRAA